MVLKVVEKQNPNVLSELQALVESVLLDMAEVGADALRENLSAGPRSGRQYPNLSRRSSAPGEFSQQQSGGLRGMVNSGMQGPNAAYFGLEPRSPADREQALAQEFGAPRKNLIGRANVRRTALSSLVHRRMIDAARRRR